MIITKSDRTYLFLFIKETKFREIKKFTKGRGLAKPGWGVAARAGALPITASRLPALPVMPQTLLSAPDTSNSTPFLQHPYLRDHYCLVRNDFPQPFTLPGSHWHLNQVSFLSLPTPLPPPHPHHPPPRHTHSWPDTTNHRTARANLWYTIHQSSNLLYPQVWDGYIHIHSILNNIESQSETVIPSPTLFQSLTTRRKFQHRDSYQAVVKSMDSGASLPCWQASRTSHELMNVDIISPTCASVSSSEETGRI